MFGVPGDFGVVWVEDGEPLEGKAAFWAGALEGAAVGPGGDFAGLVVGAFGAGWGGRGHALSLLDVDEVGCGLG